MKLEIGQAFIFPETKTLRYGTKNSFELDCNYLAARIGYIYTIMAFEGDFVLFDMNIRNLNPWKCKTKDLEELLFPDLSPEIY